MTMEPVALLAVTLVMVTIVVASFIWRGSRSESMLDQWAQANGLRLLSEERRTLFKGPYFWTSSKDQMIFYVTVQDSRGRVRHAWVRCGGFFLGMMSDNLDVEWED